MLLMNEIAVFENKQFGKIRTINDNEQIWFVARDIAEALEYKGSTINNAISVLFQSVPDIWKGKKRIFTLGGEQEMLCLSEQGLYFFLGRSDKKKALPYQMWIAGDVVPSIRMTGVYSKKLSHTELILEQAKALVEHEKEIAEQKKRLAAVESDVHMLKAKVETSIEDTFTIAGYASLKGLNLCLSKAKTLGKRATKLSKELGYVIDKTYDPRFGKVNVYHVDILKKVFKEEFAW